MEYKPLSELAKDEEACRKIFYFFTGLQIPKITYPDGFVHMQEIGDNDELHEVDIWADGDIFYSIANKKEVLECPFRIVKFIQDLGYSA